MSMLSSRRPILLAVLAASMSTSALAQIAPAAPPAPPAVAAPAAPAPAPAAAAQQPAGGPANICAELVAFLTDPAPPPPVAAPGVPPAQAAPAATAGGQPPTQAQAEGGSAQQVTNQSAPAVEAPKETGAAPAAGSGQNAPQSSGISAPTPTAGDVIKKPPTMTLAEGQALASANDISGCQAATRSMRRAGVDMPPALMTLAALDLRFLEQSSAPPPPATPSGATP